MSFRQTEGSVTAPKGFLAAGVRAGIKEQGDDLALIVSEHPASAAGVFTTNLMKAAPVLLDQARLPRATARAIIANSGNANACTGDGGRTDALRMARETASLLEVPEEDVLVCSTGIIGRRLPMDSILAGLASAKEALSDSGGESAARAIMTTDSRPKTACVELDLPGGIVRIAGMAKGAGMICPNMATMLAFITTDAALSPDLLQACLSGSVEKSFNCLTVDGDGSTNDSVIILANGAAGYPPLGARSAELKKFQDALDVVTVCLAKQIALDGEGATKLIEVRVEGARSFQDARQVAMAVANSPLVKTAVFGSDPNWGRVLAAAGRAGVDFDPSEMRLNFGPITLVKDGEPADFPEAQAHDYLRGREILVTLRIGSGPGEATVFTCDFSYDYIRINAEYHT